MHSNGSRKRLTMWPFNPAAESPRQISNYLAPTNLAQVIRPWLNLLEVYRQGNHRAEFEVAAMVMQDDFNLRRIRWEMDETAYRDAHLSLDEYPHILTHLTETWGQPCCLRYIHQLLEDKRAGERMGFPLPVFQELLLLADVLEARLSDEARELREETV